MIYVKTSLGQEAFKLRSAALHGKFRTAFLLMDGLRDSAEVIQSCAGMGFSEADFEALLSANFIQAVPQAPAPQPPIKSEVATNSSVQESTARMQTKAIRMAIALIAKAGPMNRLRLSLSVESVADVADLRALYPQIEEAIGSTAARPLGDLLSL